MHPNLRGCIQGQGGSRTGPGQPSRIPVGLGLIYEYTIRRRATLLSGPRPGRPRDMSVRPKPRVQGSPRSCFLWVMGDMNTPLTEEAFCGERSENDQTGLPS